MGKTVHFIELDNFLRNDLDFFKQYYVFIFEWEATNPPLFIPLQSTMYMAFRNIYMSNCLAALQVSTTCDIPYPQLHLLP